MFKLTAVSMIGKLLVYLLNQRKYWVCYVISREAITWGFYPSVIVKDENTGQSESIFNLIKQNASLQQPMNEDWLNILGNISIANFKLMNGESYSGNYFLSSKLLINKMFKNSNNSNFQERYIILSNEYYSSLESFKNILNSLNISFYDKLKVNNDNMQSFKISKLIYLSIEKLFKTFNNLSDSFDTLSRISFEIDEDSFRRIKSISLVNKMIAVLMNELNIINAILSVDQNVNDLKTIQSEMISKITEISNSKRSINLFDNCSSLRSITSHLLKYINEESLCFSECNSIEDIYKKIQKLYEWTLKLYSTPLDTPIHFFKLKQKSGLKVCLFKFVNLIIC